MLRSRLTLTATLWKRVSKEQKDLFEYSFEHISESRNYCVVCKNNKPRCYYASSWRTTAENYFIASTCSNECYEYIKLVVC